VDFGSRDSSESLFILQGIDRADKTSPRSTSSCSTLVAPLLPSLRDPALADAIATKHIQPADGCQSGSSGSTAIRASGGIAMVSTYGWWSAPVGE